MDINRYRNINRLNRFSISTPRLDDSLHTRTYKFFEYDFFRGWYIKNKFIMHLENHFSFEFFIANFCIYIYHGNLEHVCGCSLNRHIHSLSFGDRTDSLVSITKSWDSTSPTKVRLDIPELPPLFEEIVIVGSHSWILGIKSINIGVRFPRGTIKCFRESKSRNPVNHSKVDCLGYTTFTARYSISTRKEESCRSHMDIFSLFKSLGEIFVPREKG